MRGVLFLWSAFPGRRVDRLLFVRLVALLLGGGKRVAFVSRLFLRRSERGAITPAHRARFDWRRRREHGNAGGGDPRAGGGKK
jgi:hypothetical protein